MTKTRRQFFILIIFIFTCSSFFSGCEPLRKKFVRKKKKTQKEEFIPVLDPIDYPASRVSPLEKYEYHFSMWQVWNKELRQLMLQDMMDKRKKYLVEQIVAQLSELSRWTPEEHVQKIQKAIEDYENIRKELDKPEIMRNQSLIEGQLRRTESFMRNELDSDLVFGEKL